MEYGEAKRNAARRTPPKKKTGRGRLAVCLVIFVSAVLVKLAFPEFSRRMGDKLVVLLDSGLDYKSAFAEVGKLFSGENTFGEVIEALKPMPDKEAETVVLPAFKPSGVAENKLQRDYLSCLAAVPDDKNDETPLPENVSAAAPDLPFAFARPMYTPVTSAMGWRTHPIDNTLSYHYGTDYAADAGDEIKAFASGVVAVSGISESMGKYLIIEHPGGWETRYFHCSEVYKTGGSTVELGETVAEAGDTGRADGVHLHFELLCDGVYYDAEKCFD